jgi:putative ABC transport system permease protein
MNGLMADLKWTLRLFGRRRTFAATVILTLAVAIGAVAAAYGVATAVLWRPLPFADPDRLVFVWEGSGGAAVDASRVTGYRFHQWLRASGSFDSLSLFGAAGFTADRGEGAVNVNGVRVSTSYFDTLRVAPLLGRTFAPADGEPDAAAVVILSHALWQQWFGGRSDALNQQVRLGGRPYTVIGVMPPAVYPAWPVNPADVTLDADSRQLWVPILRTPALATSARAHVFGVVGRLRHGVSIAAAETALSQMTDPTEPDAHHAALRPFREQFVREARAPLVALIAAAFAVLLVACTNLAALQASSIEGRRTELSVRAALGAGGWRLARQFTTEAVVLTGCGAGLGSILAQLALVRVPELLPPSVPLLTVPSVNLGVVLVVAALSIGAALALAAWPIARGSRAAAPAPRGTAPLARSFVFRSLVIAQIALAMALVAVAALLQQSLNTVRAQDAGFTVDRVLVGNLSFNGPGFADPARVVAEQRRLESALAAIRGTANVAMSYDHPLEANWIDSFRLSGTAAARDDLSGSAQLRIVSPAYFDALDVALVDGRSFTERDDLGAAGAAVVNEAFARTILDGPVLSRVVRSNSPRLTWNDTRVPADFRIVGIVEDERFKGLEQPSAPAVYLSTRQFPQTQFAMLVRTNVAPETIANIVRSTVKAFDPQVPVSNLTPLAAILADQLVARRATTHAIDGFAAAGLGLAALGLYGLLAMLVTTRMRETGIRLALGSSPALEARRVLGACLVSTGVGVACGVALAMLAGRLVRGLLVGVTAGDASTLAIVSAAMVAVATIAALFPAWRAARVDPSSVLRSEV